MSGVERYLLFDSGCTTCSRLATAIEKESGGRIILRSLHELDIQLMLMNTRPGWKWEPTLLEVNGDQVRAFTGLAMRGRLIATLGLRKALRIACLVYQAGVPLAGVDLERRKVLKSSGALLAGVFLAPSFKLLANTQPTKYTHTRTSGPTIPVRGAEAETFIARALKNTDFRNVVADYAVDARNAAVNILTAENGTTIWYAIFSMGDRHSFFYTEHYREAILTHSDAAHQETRDDASYITAISTEGELLEDSSVQSTSCDGGCGWKPASWCTTCPSKNTVQTVSGYRCCCGQQCCSSSCAYLCDKCLNIYMPVTYGECGRC